MKQFDVYPRYPIALDRGEGFYVYDKDGNQYLDLYGGHAVISIGHSHPKFIERIEDQLKRLSFYSNSVLLDIQEKYAMKLGEVSGYPDYSLFLCNSGAEANENAIKLASFHTGRKKIIVFERGFHGRTSLAVEATDNTKIQAPINHTGNIVRVPWNDMGAVKAALNEDVAGVIIEGIQGISGIFVPEDEFLQELQMSCKENGSLLILDEIQSGFGRSGEFFAHHYAGIQPDIISMAKGMGNGFPIGGILIAPEIESWPGMLGTTFGGNPLACAAGLAVLEIIEEEDLVAWSKEIGATFISGLNEITEVSDVRGRGLMIGVDLPFPIKDLRKKLLMEHHIFTGSSSQPGTLRLLPPLTITENVLDQFISIFSQTIKDETISVS